MVRVEGLSVLDSVASVEAEAARKGFITLSESMRSVIRETQVRAKRRGEIDSLLLEGFGSGPATPFTDANWDSIHETLRERHSAREEKAHGPKKPKGH